MGEHEEGWRRKEEEGEGGRRRRRRENKQGEEEEEEEEERMKLDSNSKADMVCFDTLRQCSRVYVWAAATCFEQFFNLIQVVPQQQGFGLVCVEILIQCTKHSTRKYRRVPNPPKDWSV